jgi:hypothetical protein
MNIMKNNAFIYLIDTLQKKNDFKNRRTKE